MLKTQFISRIQRIPLFRRLSEKYILGLTKANMTEHSFVLVMALLIGTLGGLGAVGFRKLIELFQTLCWGAKGEILHIIRDLPWYWVLLVPATGGLIVGLIVRFFARETKGHGVPEVMEAVALRHGVIRPRVVLAKMLAAAVCIASGGSVGREGPIVQIGSALGSTIGQFFRVSKRRLRTFVGCGAAAGIAATFNAPIAGALFSVEVILGDFGISQFSPIVVSSVIATVVSRYFLGNFPAFVVPQYNLVSPWELLPYAILGLTCGLVAFLFIRILYLTEDSLDKVKLPEYIKAALGGLCIGGIGILYPEVFGVGYETITQALQGGLVWQILLALVLIKLAATSITLGSGGSGGIFAPSLFLGAMAGGFLGTLFHSFFPQITADSGAYALVGMGAVVAATTHAPITAILILFELTNDYKIILPLMLACIISTLFALRLCSDSIYTLKLVRRGVDIFQGREMNILKSMRVRDIMRSSVEIVPADTSLTKLVELAIHSPHSCFYLEDPKHKLTGVIDEITLRQVMAMSHELEHLLIAQDIANASVISVKEDDNLDRVMRQFGQQNMDELPVVSAAQPDKVTGTLQRRDAIEAYNKEILKRDVAGGMASRIQDMDQLRKVNVIGGFSMMEWETPVAFVGQTIREIALRPNYNVEVILIKRHLTEANDTANIDYLVPTADTRIQSGDVLLLFGKNKILDQIKRKIAFGNQSQS
jgi:CIC family chloride channel protein